MPNPEISVMPQTLTPTPDYDFCPHCFADNEGGSWGTGTSGYYCTNCGAGGTIKIPKWAVESIREQASWVGKRYYPSREDTQIAAELEALRALVKVMPGRSAVQSETEPGRWTVWQKTPKGETGMYCHAASADDALQKLHTKLPYVPQ